MRSQRIVLAVVLCAVSQWAVALHLNATRNMRYCELIISESKLNLVVYNTLGVNDCPDSKWRQIQAPRLKRETGAFVVMLNGPRFMVMDSIDIQQAASREVAGLTLRDEARVYPHASDLVSGQKPYITHEVVRTSTYRYKAQSPVFELIDAKGRVFVMQSYSLQKTNQTLKDLTNLQHRLNLPPAWRFKTGNIQNDAVLSVSRAVIVQDDLLNTYQYSSVDLLGA